jgi:hypothetical protein
MDVRGKLHTLAALPLVKELQYQLERRLGGPKSQSRCCGEEKNLYPCQELNPDL